MRLKENMWLDYPSSVTEIAEINKSFDACVLRVCYTGKNRNKSSISKEVIENAIPTIYNCPIVCNYSVADDSIGGHDVEVVNTKRGVRMINLTDAIGVIPSGAQYHWETIDDGDETHEYFCIDGLLWKRSSAYEKIKQDGITAQSMEITINDGKRVDGCYEIYNFDFTAFCLLGDDVEPCFESASVQAFSLAVYKNKFSEMMSDLKQETVMTASADDINDLSKGGDDQMDLTDLMAKYGLSAEDIDFDTEGMNAEDIEAEFACRSKKKLRCSEESDSGDAEGNEPAADGDADNQNNAGADNNGEGAYSLTAVQFAEELREAVCKETVYDGYWEEDVPRYWYVDHDEEAMEVYVTDRTDWKLYGMKYAVNGDSVSVDFASKVRKKITYADFEGEAPEGGITVFGEVEKFMKDKYNALKSETDSLKEFKLAEQKKAKQAEDEKVFERFSDLNGIAQFEELKQNCSDMSADDIEEKCFAIRGRNMVFKFSSDTIDESKIRIPTDGCEIKNDPDEPYNGIFKKYGF